jgi:phenylacetate-CoA ligase
MTAVEQDLCTAPDETLANLQQLIARSWDRSEFYRRLWRRAGLEPGEVPGSLEEFSIRWPTFDKSDVLADQREHPPYGTNVQVPEADIAQLHLTSNTTGVGRELYALSAADVALMGQSWAPLFEAMGLEAGDVVVSTLPVSFMTAGLSIQEGVRVHGLVGIHTGIADRSWVIDAMQRFRPSMLYGSESYVLQLLADVEAGGARLAPMKGAIVAGMSDRLITRVREVLGCETFEVYGCTQAAARIATTCRLGAQNGKLHVHSDNHLIEVVRDDGIAAGPGEDGEVILTTLRRDASPSIRFRLRDRVRRSPEPCACGDWRPALESRSVGRADDMVKIKGVNVWPAAVHDVVMSFSEVEEYRVVLDRKADGSERFALYVELRATRADTDDLLARISDAVRRRIYVRPAVAVATDLPRFEFTKARRWVDDR